MKELGKILILSAVAMIAFYFTYSSIIKERENKEIDVYIENTKIVEKEEEQEEVETVEETKKEVKKQEINYTAILEIPSINLKRGVVDSTKNFSSINYAISVDKNSNYPDSNGNFILYAHSGNSNIAYFRNLNKVNINDKVYVYYNGIKYEYQIYDKYDIHKIGKAKVISSNENKYITLITCNQNKKNYQIVVVGKLIDSTTY